MKIALKVLKTLNSAGMVTIVLKDIRRIATQHCLDISGNTNLMILL